MRHQRLGDALTADSRHRLLPVKAGCQRHQFVRGQPTLRLRTKQNAQHFRLLPRRELFDFLDDLTPGSRLLRISVCLDKINHASRSPIAGNRAQKLFAFFGQLAAARAQEVAGPEQVIRDFYGWYVGELVSERDPFDEGRANLEGYVTKRLLKEIDAMRSSPDGLEADYFLSAQDFDKEWARNVTISELSRQGERATATVELKGTEMENQTLAVSLAREDGSWKIDFVEGK